MSFKLTQLPMIGRLFGGGVGTLATQQAQAATRISTPRGHATIEVTLSQRLRISHFTFPAGSTLTFRDIYDLGLKSDTPPVQLAERAALEAVTLGEAMKFYSPLTANKLSPKDLGRELARGMIQCISLGKGDRLIFEPQREKDFMSDFYLTIEPPQLNKLVTQQPITIDGTTVQAGEIRVAEHLENLIIVEGVLAHDQGIQYQDEKGKTISLTGQGGTTITRYSQGIKEEAHPTETLRRRGSIIGNLQEITLAKDFRSFHAGQRLRFTYYVDAPVKIESI